MPKGIRWKGVFGHFYGCEKMALGALYKTFFEKSYPDI